MKRPLALLVVAACGDDPQPAFVEPTLVEVAAFPAAPVRELDLLFMIDDSPGGPEMQQALGVGLESFVARLAVVSGGELPSLHIGVATSDLGTTGSLAVQPGPPIGTLGQGGCAGAGKGGQFVTSGAPVTGGFLVDTPDGAGGRTGNYTGTLAAALTTMVKAGGGGCGFEQPFGAIRRALANPANAGFERQNAALAVIVVTDEDDCSFLDPALVDPEAPLGTLSSFRCTTQGVVCEEPIDDAGLKTGCHAREDSPYVEPIARTADFLATRKPHPSLVRVGAIAGDPSPVTIELRPPPGGGVGEPALGASCSFTGPSGPQIANPGVRVADLVTSLESRAALASVCNADLSAPLAAIARTITPALGVTCLDSTRLVDASTDPGIQPSCEVTLERGTEITPLAACPATEGDCYEVIADDVACPDSVDHLRFVTHWTSAPPADTYVRAHCEPFPPR